MLKFEYLCMQMSLKDKGKNLDGIIVLREHMLRKTNSFFYSTKNEEKPCVSTFNPFELYSSFNYLFIEVAVLLGGQGGHLPTQIFRSKKAKNV